MARRKPTSLSELGITPKDILDAYSLGLYVTEEYQKVVEDMADSESGRFDQIQPHVFRTVLGDLLMGIDDLLKNPPDNDDESEDDESDNESEEEDDPEEEIEDEPAEDEEEALEPLDKVLSRYIGDPSDD